MEVGFTVIVRVAIALPQPIWLFVYVIIAFPAEIPVTIPVVGLTVATLEFEVLQIPPLTVDEKTVVSPVHTFWLPLKTPAFGGAIPVKVMNAVGEVQPEFILRAVTVCEDPAASPV